uniref:3'-5' exonuclease domain-containing protein n=1 Tax=Tanacetum cinerariifolium TaxID=118510 RepID=A0A699SZW4_TANCI|nr:hypothetical protein [Tanacetum cinerariifolium]
MIDTTNNEEVTIHTTVTKVTHIEKVIIHTTVTSDLEVVIKWIEEVENSDNLKMKQLNIGLDTEWTPSEEKPENPIAILQLCVEFNCLIFQLNRSKKIPASLVTFFNNPKYKFTGVDIKTDCDKLKYNRAFLENDRTDFVSDMVDLRELAVEKGVSKNKEGVGMVSLAKAVLKMKMEKDENARNSIWHVEDLTLGQVKYASIDAYLSFEIGKVMLEMKSIKVK